MTCPKCSTNNPGASFCSNCGNALSATTTASYSAPSPAKASNSLSTAAIILGVVGLLFLPIVFGTAGLVLGIVAKSKNEPKANVAITVGAISLVGGMILGAIVGAATFGF
jgi:hypothetical protein